MFTDVRRSYATTFEPTGRSKHKKMLKVSLLLAFLVCAHLSEGYRILAMIPIVSKSHPDLAQGLLKALLQAGHEVTQVIPDPDKNLPPKLKQVVTSSIDMTFFTERINITAILKGENPTNSSSLLEYIELVNRVMLTEPNIQELLSDTTQTLDVVIAEWFFTDSYAGLGAVFNCPFIWFSTIEPHSAILSLIDESLNPAYVPNDQFSAVPLDFKNRVKGLFQQIIFVGFDVFYLTNYYNTVFDEVLVPHIVKRGRPAIPFSDVKYNASLVLGNSDVSFGLPIRLPQAYKTIGGYHIDYVVKPLPDYLKKILDNSKNGVIYFSMGNSLTSKDLPDQLKKDIVEVLRSLKQTVLWKFEEVLPNMPSNVHIVKWAPQQSVLAHRNCILFIANGGVVSTTEAVHFGKPIIGIPVSGSEFNNIHRAVRKGFALRVALAYDMKDKFKATINHILQNKRYTEKAKELMLIYHDWPVPPSKELVHWVEHVVKTRGAPHLRSPALDVPVYQKLYLDLLALVLAVIYVLKKIVVKICCSKKRSDEKKKRN